MKKPKKVYDPRMPRFGSGEEALVDAAYMKWIEKRIKEITDEYPDFFSVVKLEDGREMMMGLTDNKGRLGWVFKDTLEPVTDEDVKGRKK